MATPMITASVARISNGLEVFASVDPDTMPAMATALDDAIVRVTSTM